MTQFLIQTNEGRKQKIPFFLEPLDFFKMFKLIGVDLDKMIEALDVNLSDGGYSLEIPYHNFMDLLEYVENNPNDITKFILDNNISLLGDDGEAKYRILKDFMHSMVDIQRHGDMANFCFSFVKDGLHNLELVKGKYQCPVCGYNKFTVGITGAYAVVELVDVGNDVNYEVDELRDGDYEFVDHTTVICDNCGTESYVPY